MRIVIDIPEEMWQDINSNMALTDICHKYLIRKIFKNGTPLPKGHGDLKDFEKIYADMTEKEELARQRVIDTPTNSPCYMRYLAQSNERTAFKVMLFDAPTKTVLWKSCFYLFFVFDSGSAKYNHTHHCLSCI